MKPAEDKTLLYYWLILYRRRKMVLLVTFFSVIAAAIVSLTIKPVYEAYAMFYVPSSSPSMTYLSDKSVDQLARDAKVPFPKEEPQAPYIGMLKSKNIMNAVYEEFPHKSPMKYYLFDIDFELTDEFMIKIYSRDKDPVKAAAIANSYVRRLNDLLQRTSNNAGDASLLDEQVEEMQRRLAAARTALQQFETKNNIASLDEEIKNLTSQKINFLSMREANQANLEENEEKVKAISDQLSKEKEIYTNGKFSLTNPLIERLQQQLADLTVQLTAASLEYRELHPDVVNLKKRYAETEALLNKEMQRLTTNQIMPENTYVEQLRQKLGNALIEKTKFAALDKAYTAVIDRLTTRLDGFPAINMRWKRLNDEVDQYKKMYDQLKINSREARIQNVREVPFVVQVDVAKPPDRPSFPVLWLNIFVSLLFGLGAGIIYAFFLHYIEETREYRMIKLLKTLDAGE